MGIKIKSKTEIEIMRAGGKILAEILSELGRTAKAGLSTKDLDELAEALCKKNKVLPAFKGYGGFPATLCTGIDDVAVHGIPSKSDILSDGQIVSIDMGIIYNDYYSDSAITVGIGDIDANAKKLLEVTKLALQAAISKAVDGNRVGDISAAIEQVALLSGFNVIKDMTGHGIGRKLHEEPSIPCYGDPGTGPELKENMVIALEPMLNEGSSEIVLSDDEWTTKTADGMRSAIFEHTVVVGMKNAEILTKK
jgi:methionyl aminopeptidase